MAKPKKDETEVEVDAQAIDAEPRVTVINRARYEIFVEAPAPIEVVRDGEPIEGKTIMLPGTPAFSLNPKTTIFRLSDWKDIERARAIQGMLAQGQLEVR